MTPREATANMAVLYPFLGLDGGPALEPSLKAVRAQVRASTVAKSVEIAGLRRAPCPDALAACAAAMAARFAAGGRLFVFGNGGSSTDAQQVAATFLRPQAGPALPAICLNRDPAVLTALANDIGFEVVFARQLAALARPGDLAMGLSTSGGSVNLLRAFDEADRLGLLTVGLVGAPGGPMAEPGRLDHLFAVCCASVHRIQEAQTTVYGVLGELVRLALRPPSGTVMTPAAWEM